MNYMNKDDFENWSNDVYKTLKEQEEAESLATRYMTYATQLQQRSMQLKPALFTNNNNNQKVEPEITNTTDVSAYFKKKNKGIYIKFIKRLFEEISEEDARTILLDIQEKINKPNRTLEDFYLSKEVEQAITEFLIDQG